MSLGAADKDIQNDLKKLATVAQQLQAPLTHIIRSCKYTHITVPYWTQAGRHGRGPAAVSPSYQPASTSGCGCWLAAWCKPLLDSRDARPWTASVTRERAKKEGASTWMCNGGFTPQHLLDFDSWRRLLSSMCQPQERSKPVRYIDAPSLWWCHFTN